MSAAVWVQTPDMARVAAEEAATAEATRAEGEARVIQLPNNYEPAHGDEPPLMDQLIQLHRQGKVQPEPVTLGPMPRHATTSMRDAAPDRQLQLGLNVSQGYQRPLMYASSRAE